MNSLLVFPVYMRHGLFAACGPQFCTLLIPEIWGIVWSSFLKKVRDNVPTRVNFIENALALGGVIMVMSRLVNLSFLSVFVLRV